MPASIQRNDTTAEIEGTHEGIHPEDTHPVDTFAVKLDIIETTPSI